MIRLVGAIQFEQLLIFLQQILFTRFFGRRAGFFCRLLPFKNPSRIAGSAYGGVAATRLYAVSIRG